MVNLRMARLRSLVLILCVMITVPASAVELKLNKGDHVVLIGNTLAERFQYFGYFESLLHKEFTDLDLVVRNQGYCGDEVRFRPRSLDFGTPESHLTAAKADVILAFFGFNESFKGQAGLNEYRQELQTFIDDTRAQKYNGQSAPVIVLLSPIAVEDLGTRDLPDGSKANPNIKLYTQVMMEVADSNDVPFVDLFNLSEQLYEAADEPFTFNGIHFSRSGYKRFAGPLMHALFGSKISWNDDLEALRAEVNEKSFNYFHNYRAVNGYYIYGGRSRRDHGNPPYTDAYVIENERAKLDEMAAVVDQRIWKVAAGEPVSDTPDYEATRKLYEVPTNFKTPVNILEPEAAMKTFTLADGYAVNLFASEQEFPELKNPVQFTFDAEGRLWVATMESYPQYLPPNKPQDKLLVFTDTDNDGKADEMSIFADDLHLPTGFELGDGGAYVAQEPNLVFLKDTDGDGKADLKKFLLHGFDSADSHHAIGAFQWGPGGGIYMHEGTFHHTQVETPHGPVRNAHGGVYRFDPTKQQFETFVSYNFANPWGHCFNRWGQNFVADASGGANYFAAPFSCKAIPFTGQDDFGPFKFTYHEQMQQFLKKRVRPTSGCELVSSRHFPPEAQGNYLLNNVIGFQGILQHRVEESESGYNATEIEPILVSSDRNFRPVDLQFGPDGALYIVDWFNPLIGHMQHSLRDPNRDHTHGRIWRITYPSRPLVDKPVIEGKSPAELFEMLTIHEDRTRQRVRIKLRDFPTDEVLTALDEWIQGLEMTGDEFEHALLEALWVCQHHNVYDGIGHQLLIRLIESPNYNARAAAVRVLSFWRYDVPQVHQLLKNAVEDEHPRVRLEAVRACSYLDDGQAAEIALSSLKSESDYYIDYALRHTIRALEPHWKTSVGSGVPFAADNPLGLKYIIANVATEDLVNMARSELVYQELLTRPKVVHQYRHEALQGLAELHKSDVTTELLVVTATLDKSDSEHAAHVITELVHMYRMQSVEALGDHREAILDLRNTAQKPITRQVATVALIAADGSAEQVWGESEKSVSGILEALSAVPLIADDEIRESLYKRVSALTSTLPEPLQEKIGDFNGAMGQIIRIELPGNNRVLTLAEVEVNSDGKNIAKMGKPRQSTLDFGGVAYRAIDGNKSGVYSDNGQTHTKSQQNPFWELNFGKAVPIDSIVIWNRTENNGTYVNRLDGCKVSILDSNRAVVLTRTFNKATAKEMTVNAASANPKVQIARAAVTALSYIGGHDQETFDRLAPLVAKGAYRVAAVQSIGRLRRGELMGADVQPVIDALLKYIESVPAQQRTRTQVMDAIQLGKDLSGLLGKEKAIAIRRRLADLAVDVFVVRPIPHRMVFDRPHLYVQAGKPVEIVFENTDIMPHNLLVTVPDAREEVGILAERLGARGGFAQQFIPDSPKVLHATNMLQPGESQRLQIVAPQAIGDYPFVCTFPGHWRTMYGTLHVVADISDIPLQPTEPESIHGDIPQRQFVRKWSTEDVVLAIPQLESGRSFEKGRKLFTAVSCVACHAMKGTGGKVGPDLAEVQKKLADQKLTLPKLVESLVHPSQEIPEKYRTQIIVTTEGKLFSGVIVDQDDKLLKLTANPLEKDAKVTQIPKADIDEQDESKVSIMPEGLLNTMTRDEILDLIAYIISGANPEHPAFRQ